MHTVHLGRTGLKVTPLCLGTMNFGPWANEEDSFAIMDRALDEGLLFWDTADVYGGTRGEALTEKLLGRYFAQGGGRRERVVLATKVFGPMNPESAAADPNLERGLSARKIIQECEASLRRMQVDHIDIYQMHHVDRACPVEEILQAMEKLILEGKIHYMASSNFAGWDIAKFNEIARARGGLGLVSEQCVYNLTNRGVEGEVLPAAQHYGMGVLPWSPLAGGMLGGVLEKHEDGRRGRKGVPDRVKAIQAQLEAWENLARDLGHGPGELALAWLRHQPVVTAPIIGPRTMAQLESALRSLAIEIDGETLRRIDDIWEPVGSSPENFAW